jgi:hypothetical protein
MAGVPAADVPAVVDVVEEPTGEIALEDLDPVRDGAEEDPGMVVFDAMARPKMRRLRMAKSA